MSYAIRSAVVLVCLSILVATIVARHGTETSAAAVSSTLHASVGPGYDISLTFDDKSPVTALPAGTYRILVDDQAQDHNFHLVGAGVDEATPVETTASPTWTVTFKNNETYTFQCDPHADSMYGHFDVGAVAAQAPPSSSTSGGSGGVGGSSAAGKTAIRTVATLLTSVGSTGKLSLTVAGKPVKSLAPGSYRIAAADSSPKYAVSLRRAGGPLTTLTTAAFVGKRTVTTRLTAGTWTLSSPPAKAIVFRVAAT